ncbi:MAG: hypothetical protein AAB481_00010 [Patescibacteria group bacterium]
MKPINISSLIKKYGPGYVAKNKKTGRVVAHAKRLDVLFEKTRKKTDITIAWIPQGNTKYVFRVSL